MARSLDDMVLSLKGHGETCRACPLAPRSLAVVKEG